MKAFLTYSFLRLLLLLGVGAGLYLITLPLGGMPPVLLLLAAFIGSGILSYGLLGRPRGEFGTSLSGFFGRINQRIDAATTAEDAPEPPPATNAAPEPGPDGPSTADPAAPTSADPAAPTSADPDRAPEPDPHRHP